MRSLPTLLASTLLSIVVGACDGTEEVSGPAYHVSSKAPTTESVSAARTLTSVPLEHYLNDGDHDPIGDADGDNRSDNDKDAYLDYKPDDNRSYTDSDDSRSLANGHAASAVEERTIAAVVERYYATAAAEDGAGACSQLPSALATAAPLILRHVNSHLGPANTCAAALARLFKQSKRQLASPVHVTGVRVQGEGAAVLLGSRTMPASYIAVEREAGLWKIAELLGPSLP